MDHLGDYFCYSIHNEESITLASCSSFFACTDDCVMEITEMKPATKKFTHAHNALIVSPVLLMCAWVPCTCSSE